MLIVNTVPLVTESIASASHANNDVVLTQPSLLIGLLLAHLLADFYLQPYSWVESRNKKHARAPHVYAHALIHGLLASIAMYLFAKNISHTTLILGCTAIAVSHYAIDIIKSYCPKTPAFFLLDQCAHLLIIACVFVFITDQAALADDYLAYIGGQQIAVLLAYLAVLKPSSIVIKQLLSPWSNDVSATNERGSNPVDALTLSLEARQTLALAGQRIGYLERILVLTFVLLNQFSAIGFLIAAKSIFRFGDLTKHQDRKLTEYVLLGTLTSVTITIAIGLLCAWYLGHLPFNVK